MTERVIGPTGSPRRRWTLFLPLIAVLALGLFYVAGASAVHDDPPGLFELDRNPFDGSADGDDWNTPPAPTGAADDFTGILDDIGVNNPSGGGQFQGGGSKDDLDISNWLWKAGEPLDKDDITNAYAAAYTNTVDTGLNNVGDLIIYHGLDRFSTSGSAQVGFWFLQDPNFGLSDTASGGGFKFNGVHQNNDVLVQSNFSNGGVISNITVYKWLSGALVQVAGATDCVGPPPSAPDDPACGTVNRVAVPNVPWSYTPKANEGPAGTFQPSAFFEAGLNISRLIPAAGCFTAFMAETRSSTPFDARLKDFVIGDLDTCVRDVRVLKTPDAGTANAGDTISFSMNVKNIGNASADNVTLSDNLPNTALNWSITSQPAGDPCAITGAVGSQVLACNFGTLAVDAERVVTISSPTTAASCGTKNNTVTISATGDIDATNNTDNGSIVVSCGAIRILKNSTKGGAVNNAGAVFSVDGPDAGTVPDFSVTDDITAAAPDEDADVGEVCVSGLQPGATYTVNETSPPSGYGGASQLNVTVVAVSGSCTAAGLNSATFTNPPLGEVVINYNDLGSNETSAKIDCAGRTPTPADATPTAHDDDTETYTNLPAGSPPIVYTCTISVDP
jgi:uncharacterized repeat protein (TIGR01451 family)